MSKKKKDPLTPEEILEHQERQEGKNFIKAKKNPQGRPIILTDELTQKICAAIQRGAHIETAVALCGIHKQTFYDWLKRGKKEPGSIFERFTDAVNKAIAEGEMRDIMNIDQAAMGRKATYLKDAQGKLILDGNGNPILESSALAPTWTASAWRLERKFPDRWGRKDRMELSGSGGGPIETSQESTEERRARIKAMMKRLAMLEE
jgi:transposase